MTFDEVGAPARLSGGPSPATNIPVVHTLLMAIQSTSDLEPEEPRKRYEKYFFEFMYLFNSCIYYFLIHVFIIFEYMYLFLTIKLFLFIIISRHVFCYIHFMT